LYFEFDFTDMQPEDCDLAIIGAGVTGLSAALAAYSRNPELKIKLFGIPFDSNTAKKGEIENIPGFERVVGVDLIQKITGQLGRLNAEYFQSEDKTDAFDLLDSKASIQNISDNVKTLNKINNGFEIVTDEQKFIAKSVILSTGLPELKNTIKGEEDFLHKGVSHCAVCDGALFRGKKAVIIGTGNFIARGALYLRKFCRKITVLCPESELGCDKRFTKKIEKSPNIKLNFEVNLNEVEIFGSSMVQGIRYHKDGESKEISADVVFIELKDKPNLEYANNIGLNVNKLGYILTNENNSTNVQGVFAAGTAKGEIDYAPVLIGDGYKAGIYAVNFLET
jgi:thioredoxin reductase (NADPH)